jgi:nucleoside-diphosphate-sugar epimerase
MMGAITIIGAAGFVGTRLIEALVLDGRTDVQAVVRAYRNLASLARFGPAVKVRLADAEDSASLLPALSGSSVVVNLCTGAPSGIIRSTRSILEACVAANVSRLIHLSSAVVYGEVTSPRLDDDAPPVSGHWMPYARAKAVAEIWLRDQLAAAPCQVAVLRPGIVWGVRSPHTMRAVNALLEKRAYLVGDGQGVFNSVYIDNLVSYIRTCSDHPGNIRGFYNVADQEFVTWRDSYSYLAGSLGYDMSRMPTVSGERFPWSARAALEYVQSLPIVNGLYHRLKAQLPDTVKSRIKKRLSGRYEYDRGAISYVTKPTVDRELWYLQKVRHKLPVDKFAQYFGFTPPVTFEEGIRRTLRWLTFLGYAPSPTTVLTEDR